MITPHGSNPQSRQSGSNGLVDVPLTHGQPIVFGADGHLGVVQNTDGSVEVVEVSEVGADRILMHDEHHADPSLAFALSRLTDAGVMHRSPIGIFRNVERPAYDDLARQQIEMARGAGSTGLQDMVNGRDTWTVL